MKGLRKGRCSVSIHFDEESRSFHLRAGASSYVLQIYKEGYLVHRYWGPRLAQDRLAQPLVLVGRAFSPNPDPSDEGFSLDTLPQEYPAYGLSDFRTPAIEVYAPEAGTATVDFRYVRHRIRSGKPRLPGLPATYVESDQEAETLEIDLYDALTGLEATLQYTAFAQHAVIARSVMLVNGGSGPLQIERVMSAALDLPDATYDWVHLAGAWGRERHALRERIAPGARVIESRRGASSHQANPFIALARPDATETHGDVFGLSLVYSGNFLMSVDVDQYSTTRLLAGINPSGFSWLLEPGESFCSPEALLTYTADGFGGLSHTMHRLLRTRLARGVHRDKLRPVLLNNWEATYFQFDRDSLVELAQSAADLGVELFVLDDGWFGHRNNDRTSLGDWVVDRAKLPDGLADVAKRIVEKGLQFGLWFEPEMISPDSDLYRMHPDWCLHVQGRARSQGRHQLVLDLSRADVRAYIVRAVSEVLRSAPISYVKWDMNRNMTEVGSAPLPVERQLETAHRYMLGLYEVLETLITQFPDILFESCSGGGGRFDPGMLYYMPQVWTSDNTDAVERLPIQFGTSLIYPASSMGAHVSAVPNHQVGRITPLETRGFVAMMGNFGYELDVRALSQGERALIGEQIAFYKMIRPLVMFGQLHRLREPQGRDEAAWLYVSQDRQEAIATFVRVLAQPNEPLRALRLRGLDPARQYHVRLYGGDHLERAPDSVREVTARGDELMAIGVMIPHMTGDYRACTWHLRAL